jgi:excisionase family DNA binding protein
MTQPGAGRPTLDTAIPDLINSTTAARLLGVAVSSVHRMFDRGELAGVQVGNQLLFRPSVISAAARSRQADQAERTEVNA